MNTKRMISLGMVAGLAAGLSLGSAALGQEETKVRELKGELARPLSSGKTTATAGGSQSTLFMSQNNNGDEITVRVENGELSATRNGKPIPADKVRKTDNKVEILGDKGEVISTFRTGLTGAETWIGSGEPKVRVGVPMNWRRAQVDGKDGGYLFVGAEQPKVMVGINMSTADGKLAEHLGLKEGGVMLDSVIEGLPAAKAGLKAHDVLVEVDGKRVKDENEIRDALKSKNPGDTIKVKYIRQGAAEQEAAITLDAFDAKKLGDVQGFAWRDDAKAGENPFGPDWAQNDESPWVVNLGGLAHIGIDQKKIREALEMAMREVEDNHKQVDEIRVQVRKHIEEAMKELSRSQRQFEEHSKELGDALRIESLPRLRSIGRNGNMLVEKAPQDEDRAVAKNENQKNEKFDRILESLERLNKRLDDLEKRVESKK